MAGLTLLGGIGLGVWSHLSGPALPIPVPPELDRAEPQLRAYILEEVDWVKASPREANRRATLGLVYAANALWPEARAAFLDVVQLNPKEPLAPLYVAVASQEMGELKDALKRLRQLTVEFPRFAPGFYRLGDLLARTGAFDEAAGAFQRLQELAPAEWRGFAGLGECRLRQGNGAEAVKLLEQAVRLAPQEKLAHHLLGQAYQRVGRADEAERESRLGLNALHFPMPDAWSAQAPRHMRLLPDLIEMATEYTARGQSQKAIDLLAPALAYNPTNLSLLNHLGSALNQAGQPRRAKALLLKALQIDPHYLPACVALSSCCLALGQREEALQYANRAVELNPKQAYPHLAKANVWLALDRDAEAALELKTAAQCDPQNAQLQVELGDVCWRNLNRPAEALQHYRQATELDPLQLPALARLVEVHLQLGQTNDAQRAVAAARRLCPEAPALQALERRLGQNTPGGPSPAVKEQPLRPSRGPEQ